MREAETGWGQLMGVSIGDGDGGGHPTPDPPPSPTRLASDALLCYFDEAIGVLMRSPK